jgi:hypothetical protein
MNDQAELGALMSYRNGTYVAFHANGKKQPTESDIKYYDLLKAWNANPNYPFRFVESHEKTGAIRDSTKRATVAQALRSRLNGSKNMVLIIGETTAEDPDWIPLEIAHAVDEREIPVIATYTGYNVIGRPALLSELWPAASAERIGSGAAHVIHIPFAKQPINAAIAQFSHENYPNGSGLGVYDREAYRSWALAR